LWIATAATHGSAHLVPFSFVWDGKRISMATAQNNPTARNAARTSTARRALGNIHDIVLIDGAITAIPLQALHDALAERLSRISAIDARQAPGYVYLQLIPIRIQAWWSAAELAQPTIMQEGRWLAYDQAPHSPTLFNVAPRRQQHTSQSIHPLHRSIRLRLTLPPCGSDKGSLRCWDSRASQPPYACPRTNVLASVDCLQKLKQCPRE
jgi:hypothetical protein